MVLTISNRHLLHIIYFFLFSLFVCMPQRTFPEESLSRISGLFTRNLLISQKTYDSIERKKSGICSLGHRTLCANHFLLKDIVNQPFPLSHNCPFTKTATQPFLNCLTQQEIKNSARPARLQKDDAHVYEKKLQYSYAELFHAYPDINTRELNKIRVREELYHILKDKQQCIGEFHKHYRIDSFLGDGAFGLVFIAVQIKTGLRVSVKILKTSSIPPGAWLHDPATREIIPQEVYFLKMLSHPCIVKLIAYYKDRDRVYIVTEFFGDHWTPSNPVFKPTKNPGIVKRNEGDMYVPSAFMPFVPSDSRLVKYAARVDGMLDKLALPTAYAPCDLFECIEIHKKMDMRIIQRIFGQLVAAVAYMHSNGVAHKDIKDENVLVDSTYRIKVIDFGSSVVGVPDTGGISCNFTGTLHFASPEIMSKGIFGVFEADVWALGVLLYTMLFGNGPFSTTEDLLNVRYALSPSLNINEPELCDVFRGIFKLCPEERMNVFDLRECVWLRKKY